MMKPVVGRHVVAPQEPGGDEVEDEARDDEEHHADQKLLAADASFERKHTWVSLHVCGNRSGTVNFKPAPRFF